MKQIDFSSYRFRCSQLSKLMTGTIGLTEQQEYEMRCLNGEKRTGINANGNKIKFTPTKQEKLSKLTEEFNNPTTPKTMQTELRKIYRMEKFNRNFPFTNKYIQKGIQLEEEAITLYQVWRNANGVKTFFEKNGERLQNDYFSGEPDLRPVKVLHGDYKGMLCGFDIKNSYDLSTFPFPEDKLIDAYEYQMQGYMSLEKADVWLTVFCLCNATEYAVFNEKIKWDNTLRVSNQGTPAGNPDHPYYEEYIERCKEVERQMIFDYERFTALYPYHILEHSKEEWFDNSFDIPLSHRIIEKVSERDEGKIKEMEQRCIIGRKYLQQLQKQDHQKLIKL